MASISAPSSRRRKDATLRPSSVPSYFRIETAGLGS
jgi:hypothetical protein